MRGNRTLSGCLSFFIPPVAVGVRQRVIARVERRHGEPEAREGQQQRVVQGGQRADVTLCADIARYGRREHSTTVKKMNYEENLHR